MHFTLKSREISSAHNLLVGYQIDLKFCTEQGSITVVLCANCQSDLKIEMDVRDKQDFARVEFEMSFGRISYIATAHWAPFTNMV